MPITCPNCGTSNPETNRFCQRCGQPLAPTPQAALDPAQQPMPPPAQPPAQGETVIPPQGVVPPAQPPTQGVPVTPPQGAASQGGGTSGASGSTTLPPQVPQSQQQYAPPSGYGTPPYGTGGPVPSPHRLPIYAIIGGIIMAMIILVLTAVVVHAISNPSTPTPIPLPTAPPTAIPTSLPTSVPTILPTVAPTGAVTPVPTVGPTQVATSPAPTPGPGPGAPFSNTTLSANIPAGWSRIKSDNTSVTFNDLNGNGIIFIASFALKNPPVTLQQIVSELTQGVQKDSPDAKDCGGGQTSLGLGTPVATGSEISFCYSFTPNGGTPFPAVDDYFVAVNHNQDTLYEVNLFGPQDKFKALATDAGPIVRSIQWKIAP